MIVASASVPGSPVDTVPIVKVISSPAGPVGPVGPVGPAQKVGLGEFLILFKALL